MTLLEVGKIAKPHGLRGEVVVELFTNRDERVAKGSQLHTSEGRELVVQSSRRHQHRWIVKFNDVDSREAADELHGAVLLAEPIDDPEALWVHELLGMKVVDAEGVARGVVKNIVANPAGDLIETDLGHLIPLRFVTEKTTELILVDPPSGLFDLLD